jgi:hypothetical protein
MSGGVKHVIYFLRKRICMAASVSQTWCKERTTREFSLQSYREILTFTENKYNGRPIPQQNKSSVTRKLSLFVVYSGHFTDGIFKLTHQTTN